MPSLRTALRPFRVAVQNAGRGTRPSLHRLFHASRHNAGVYSKADKETFDKILKESETANRVVLVDFYADWCQPCHMLSPILEKLASEPNTSAKGLPVDLVKIDTETDEGLSLAQAHKVHALPTVYIYKDGKAVTHFKGALPEAQVKQILDSL